LARFPDAERIFGAVLSAERIALNRLSISVRSFRESLKPAETIGYIRASIAIRSMEKRRFFSAAAPASPGPDIEARQKSLADLP